MCTVLESRKEGVVVESNDKNMFVFILVYEEWREVRDEVDYRKSKWGKKGHDVEQKL